MKLGWTDLGGKMTTTAIDSLGIYAIEQATQAAAHFMIAEKLIPTDPTMKRIITTMRVTVKAVLTKVLDDDEQIINSNLYQLVGKEATDANLSQLIGYTMAASFRLAGIQAVKEVMCWSGCECQFCTGTLN